MTDDRRLMAVRISQELLIEMLTTGWESQAPLRCIDGVPPGATLMNTFTDPATGDGFYVFQSQEFDVVQHGQHIPIKAVTFQVEYAAPSA